MITRDIDLHVYTQWVMVTAGYIHVWMGQKTANMDMNIILTIIVHTVIGRKHIVQHNTSNENKVILLYTRTSHPKNITTGSMFAWSHDMRTYAVISIQNRVPNYFLIITLWF